MQKRRNKLKATVDDDPILKAIVHAVEIAATSETDYARSVRLAKAARKKILDLYASERFARDTR